MTDLSPGNILAVIGIITAAVTLIFNVGVFIGAMWNKLARHDDQIIGHTDQLRAHAGRLDDHDDELKFIKGIR